MANRRASRAACSENTVAHPGQCKEVNLDKTDASISSIVIDVFVGGGGVSARPRRQLPHRTQRHAFLGFPAPHFLQSFTALQFIPFLYTQHMNLDG
jgi:hypothetical protein